MNLRSACRLSDGDLALLTDFLFVSGHQAQTSDQEERTQPSRYVHIEQNQTQFEGQVK